VEGRPGEQPAGAGATARRALRAAGGLVPLVGRQRELALLDQVLGAANAEGASAPLLLLAGEPGIGKTRLLEEAARRGLAAGWTVLTGGCQRRGGQDPYSPLLDALAQHLHALPAAMLRDAIRGCTGLVSLMPELADVLEPLPARLLSPEQERRLLFAAVARLLANVAGPAGTLLVLDDLHWAGPDALDLLAALLRTPPTAPTLAATGMGSAGVGVLRVVAAYRDTEVRPADPMGLLLADLAQAGLVRHHPLGPLAMTDAAALLADLLAGAAGEDRAVAERVLQRAGGIPFFLVSYAHALHSGARAAEAAPWDVAQGVRQRVALLPEVAQEVLGAAAIIGRQMPRELLAAAVGRPEEEVLAGVEAACQTRLLLEDGPDSYAFAHDVIREVVEADLSAARRTLLHRRVAAALEAQPGASPVEMLAYHYGRGGLADKAVVYLEQAGDQAWTQRAHGLAEGHFREALDALERAGRATDALRLREKLAEVLYQTGRYEAAIAVLGPAAEAWRAGDDLESLGRVAVQIGWMHSLRGTPQAGLEFVQPLVGLLEGVLEQGGSSRTLPALYTTLGQLLYAAGQYEASLTANERALALAPDVGDGLPRARAAYNRLVVFLMLGRLTDALRASREVLPLVEAVGHLTTLLAVLRDLSYIHALRGEMAASREAIELAAILAEQMADPGPAAYTRAQRAWVAVLGGDAQGASAALDEAVALSRQGHRSWYSSYPLIFQARLHLVQGRWAEARTMAQEALALAEDCDDLQARRWAATDLATLDILEGRPEAARDRLLPLLDRPGVEECDVTTLLPVLAWAYLQLEQVEQANELVGQALARGRREDMRFVLVEALRVQALVEWRQGHRSAAITALEEGLALARRLPYPYAEARLLYLAAELHAQSDEPDRARPWLDEALTIFRRLGAHPDTERRERTSITPS
jgi:tetratricopeptide (TPR) repeat protein